MQTAQMRQAMSTLKAFSEEERADHADQARQNVLREQQSIRSEREDARAARAAAEHEKEAERQAREAASAKGCTASARGRATSQRRSPGRGRAPQSSAARPRDGEVGGDARAGPSLVPQRVWARGVVSCLHRGHLNGDPDSNPQQGIATTGKTAHTYRSFVSRKKISFTQ